MTANRLKLGRNSNRSLAGPGIIVDMNPNLTQILERNREICSQWFSIFMDNIHMLTFKPNKWNKSTDLPNIENVGLFVFDDSKSDILWKLIWIIKR